MYDKPVFVVMDNGKSKQEQFVFVLHHLVVQSTAIDGYVRDASPFPPDWVIHFHDWDVTKADDLILKDAGFVELAAF